MIRIGLIDSGINIDNPLIVNKGYIINGWTAFGGNFNDTLGHGTRCVNLILKDTESLFEIYNVKVFDKTLRTSTKNILDALQWCIQSDSFYHM